MQGLTRRIKIVNLVLVVLGAVLVGRLFVLQVVRNEYYRERAIVQQTRVNPQTLKRGDIYFQERGGNRIAAATVRRGNYLALRPSLISDAAQMFEALRAFVPRLDAEAFFAHASNKDDPFEIVAHRLEEDVGRGVFAKGFQGVEVGREEWRFYPGASLAAHVVGFMGYRDDTLQGQYGIERAFEDELSGNAAANTAAPEERSGNGFLLHFLKRGRSLLLEEERGGDIVLTIEPTVERVLEDALESAKKRWNARQAGGIIIEPATGKILAMAAKPDFDPNLYNKETDVSVFVNPLVEHVFEVGSIFKPLTLAAAIDQKRIKPDSTYLDRGFVELDGKRIENFDGKGRGKVDMQEVLNQSLNTGAVFAMQQLGKTQFRSYLEQYGFSEYSGIDLPGEVKSNMANLSNSRDIEYATAAFGQGIALTPIALVSALSALANGGNLMRPYVVEKIDVAWGPDMQTAPFVRRRVITEETSRTISAMLTEVVDTALLGGEIKFPQYTVAAKTGTAQIPQSNARGYSDEFLHSFFGYAPASNPQFLVFLYLERPQGITYAAYSLGPTFRDMMEFLLNYYDVAPDR